MIFLNIHITKESVKMMKVKNKIFDLMPLWLFILIIIGDAMYLLMGIMFSPSFLNFLLFPCLAYYNAVMSFCFNFIYLF